MVSVKPQSLPPQEDTRHPHSFQSIMSLSVFRRCISSSVPVWYSSEANIVLLSVGCDYPLCIKKRTLCTIGSDEAHYEERPHF